MKLMMCNFRKRNIFFKKPKFQFQLFCDALHVCACVENARENS